MITNTTGIKGTAGVWRMAFDMQRSPITKAITHWLVMSDGKAEYRALLNSEALGDDTAAEAELRRATAELMSMAGLADD